MSLSVCMLTDQPAWRVARVLEPLRPLADEIVLAVDATVEDRTVGAYADLADRLLRCAFRFDERRVGWLFRQCSGDWILRVDGDEVLSAALLERLPGLLAARRVQQYWIARAWLEPGSGRVLAGLPWSDDYRNVLVRNDGTLDPSGGDDGSPMPVAPRAYVEEPIYRLALLLADEGERRAEVVRREAARPRVAAPGGGRSPEMFYLPELQPALRTRAVPDEDAARTRAVLEAPEDPMPAPSPVAVPLVTTADADRWRAGRTLAETAYAATIEPVADDLGMQPGEAREVLFRVRNEGTELWTWRPDVEPLIRLSYRWYAEDGSISVPEGLRSSLACEVEPGATVVTPALIAAPRTPGRYELEVDLVHEHVRWFGCPVRLPVTVAVREGLRPFGARLTETPRERPRWAPGAVRIPRLFHRVWLGPAPLPDEHRRFGRTFRRHHPAWRMRLWTDTDLPRLGIGAEDITRARSHSELSDLVRFEVLRRFGGVYVDTDVECLRRMTPLLRGVDAFAALEDVGRVGTAVLGAVPGHPLFGRAAREARRTIGSGAHAADATGPYFLSLLLEQEPGLTIFGADRFYPYRWDEPERAAGPFPDAYLVHHWAQSWRSSVR